jgi:hypothetical protein
VHKEDTQTEQIKQLLKSIKEYQHDLQRLLLSKDTFEKGFRNFFKNLDGVDIDAIWWNELLEYFKQTLQSEIGWWKETDVENAVLRFCNKKMQEMQEMQEKQEEEEEQNEQDNSDIGNKKTDERVDDEKVKTKTQKAQDTVVKVSQANLQSVQLKLILIEVLNNFPETADLINENLG